MYSERVVCNTVYIINAKKLVIKYEWIELVDNGSTQLCLTLSQVSDKELMNLIRQKVKLALPYAGAFLKKDDRWVY